MADNGWHLDKRVSIGHVVTTLVVAASVFIWATSIEQRVGLNSAAIQATKERLDRSDASMQRRFDEIIRRLELIDSAVRGRPDR